MALEVLPTEEETVGAAKMRPEEGESHLGQRRSSYVVCRIWTLKAKRCAKGKLNTELKGWALCWSNHDQ